MSIKPTNPKDSHKYPNKAICTLKYMYVFHQIITIYGTCFLDIQHSQENEINGSF